MDEAPFVDGASSRELGMRPREYTIDMLFAGPDYDLARDRMIREIEANATGELLHPRYGAKMVTILDSQITHSTELGGMCSITVTCVDTSSAAMLPAQEGDLQGDALTALDEARAAARADFEDGLLVEGSSSLQVAALNNVQSTINDVRERMAQLDQLLSTPSNVAGRLAAMSEDAASLIFTPGELWDRLQAEVASVFNSVGRIIAAVESMLPFDLAGIGSQSKARTAVVTDLDQRERDNTLAIRRAMKASMLLNLATPLMLLGEGDDGNTVRGTAARPGYKTTQQARATRTKIMDAVSDLVENEEPGDAMVDALVAVAAAVADYLDSDVLGDLPSQVTYTPAQSLPACVIAFHLYGDASREAEVVRRNVIANPLIVGRPLLVLSD